MVSISKVGRIFSTCFSRHCVGFSLFYLVLSPLTQLSFYIRQHIGVVVVKNPRNLPVAQLELLWYDECCIRI